MFNGHPSNKDDGAVIAPDSFLHDGKAVLPCSSASLGAIAITNGSGSNLLTRAAMATLKERRPRIACHRETPFSLIDTENMRSLTLAGAIVCPANPALCPPPRSVEHMVDFIAGTVPDLLGVPYEFKTRWSPDAGAARSRGH